MNRLIIIVLGCMCVGIFECGVGSDSPVYLDTNGWDQVVEFKSVGESKNCEIVRF